MVRCTVVRHANRQLFYRTAFLRYDLIKSRIEEEHDMQQQLGENISKFRRERNMTQDEFALRLGVTPQAVSKWERGNSLPDITLAAEICRVLEVRADTLFGLEAEPFCEREDFAIQREIRQNLIAEPLRIEIGYGLVTCFTDGLKTDYLDQCRKRLAAETGMLLPILRILDEECLQDTEVRILSYDRILLQKTFENADLQTYHAVIDETVRLCRENYGSLLNKQIVKTLLNNLHEQYPGILDGLVPDKAGYYRVLEELRKRIAEKGNIRDLIHIMEEIETALDS